MHNLPDGFQLFRPIQRGEFFVIFVDTAAGGGDNCAVQFLSTKWLDIPMVYWSKVTAVHMTPLLPPILRSIYEQTGIRPLIAYETNNGGGFEFERLGRLNRNGEWRMYTQKNLSPSSNHIVDTGKLGWNTNTGTRPKMLSELKDAVESEQLHVYHRATVDEMFSFIISKTGKPQAEENAHDDLVMALAGAWQLYQTERPEGDQESSVVESEPIGGYYKEAGILVAGGGNDD